MYLNKIRLVGLAAMLGEILGAALSPVLAHLWNTYSHDYSTYGKLYFLSLPPELLGLYILRAWREGGSGPREKWGFRLALVGVWLSVIGVFTDYWVPVPPGFWLVLVGTPLLMTGFVLLGVGLRRAGAVPLGITLLMVGAVVAAFPVTFLLVDHVPGGPLLTFHIAWIALGYVIWSGKDASVRQPVVTERMGGSS